MPGAQRHRFSNGGRRKPERRQRLARGPIRPEQLDSCLHGSGRRRRESDSCIGGETDGGGSTSAHGRRVTGMGVHCNGK